LPDHSAGTWHRGRRPRSGRGHTPGHLRPGGQRPAVPRGRRHQPGQVRPPRRPARHCAGDLPAVHPAPVPRSRTPRQRRPGLPDQPGGGGADPQMRGVREIESSTRTTYWRRSRSSTRAWISPSGPPAPGASRARMSML